jgi:hypothetical protein
MQMKAAGKKTFFITDPEKSNFIKVWRVGEKKSGVSSLITDSKPFDSPPPLSFARKEFFDMFHIPF